MRALELEVAHFSLPFILVAERDASVSRASERKLQALVGVLYYAIE